MEQRGGEMRNTNTFLVGQTQRQKNHLTDFGVDDRTILKWVLKIGLELIPVTQDRDQQWVFVTTLRWGGGGVGGVHKMLRGFWTS
jgi:hypothetical protein